jgi:hypothetical protein
MEKQRQQQQREKAIEMQRHLVGKICFYLGDLRKSVEEVYGSEEKQTKEEEMKHIKELTELLKELTPKQESSAV